MTSMLRTPEELIEQLLQNLPPLGTERISLGKSFDRVVSQEVHSNLDLPGYNESLRDGFAIHKDFVLASDGSGIFKIIGEIAAGENRDIETGRQQAFAIMTGAEVPKDFIRVVPKELCNVEGGFISVPDRFLRAGRDFIKPKASVTKAGNLMVPAGVVLAPEHLAQLAAVGVDHVRVFRRPKVCFFCTGKELVASKGELKTGQKISSNQYLLSGLVNKFGGECHDLGIVDDNALQLKRVLSAIDLKSFDLVVSTGGTGPGKFDLIGQAFRDIGGHLHCTTLGMRPGKSIIMGRLAETIFCGLPGPPAAVETLLYEVVGPILLKLQGVRGVCPEVIQAYLEDDLEVKSREVVQIKSGVYKIKKGKCWVSRVGTEEYSTCNVVVPPGTKVLNAGQLVDVHLKSSPFFSTLRVRQD